MNCIPIERHRVSELHNSERSYGGAAERLYGGAAEGRGLRRGDRSCFDWEKAVLDCRKFTGIIRCHKPADRIFLLKAVALTQRTIPPWCVWDALEAVRQIEPVTPIAYFRTVLRANCDKTGVDLGKALRTVRVPASLPRYRTYKRPTSPLADEAMRLRAQDLQEAIR
jgi:hypothetical protein